MRNILVNIYNKMAQILNFAKCKYLKKMVKCLRKYAAKSATQNDSALRL